MAERRKLIRDSSARLGPSNKAQVVHKVPAGTVIGVVPENLWSDATFFKALLGDRYVYFRAEDAVQADEDVTPPRLLSLLDAATPDAAADVPAARDDVEDTTSSESVHPARRPSKKRLAFTSDQTTLTVSRKMPLDVGFILRDDIAKPVRMIALGLLIIAVSAGVLALTTAYPIGGYSIVATGGFVFGPLMAIMGLLGLGKVLLASLIE